MSLQNLAQHIQSAGRDEDTMLVHMTPKEVGGLQALAMAHGGSLTINPETGLPEAGFLKAILPMVAGLALGPAGLGLTAMQAGLAAGALGTVATGSLKEGLMAGFGAYGGAGLGGGLKAMGSATSSALAPTGAAQSTLGANNLFANAGVENIVANPMQQVAGSGMGANMQSMMYTQPAAMSAPALSAGSPFAGTGVSAANFPGAAANAARTAGANIVSNAAPSLSALPQMPAAPAAPAASSMPQLSAQQMQMQAFNAPGQVSPPGNPLMGGVKQATSNGLDGLKQLHGEMEKVAPYASVAGLGSLAMGMQPKPIKPKEDVSMIRPYEFQRTVNQEAFDVGEPIWSDNPGSSRERMYFNSKLVPLKPYKAPGPEYEMADGGAVESMSNANMAGMNTGYPMARMTTTSYSGPESPRPQATNVLSGSSGPAVGAYSGAPAFADGGMSHLGDYSDGGRLLRGPGDGVSDSIPAVIADKQPARLADGEFVVPARIVSEIGNGSTEAGARKLYAMMDRVQRARKKTTGKNAVAKDTKAEKLLPA